MRLTRRARWQIFMGVVLVVTTGSAQPGGRVELGRLATGATVAFSRGDSGAWGVEIEGVAGGRVAQPEPAQLELFYLPSEIRHLAAGYQTIARSETGIDATATVVDGHGAAFRVRDQWAVEGAVVTLRRAVDVTAGAAGGFASSVEFALDPSVSWTDLKCFAPGPCTAIQPTTATGRRAARSMRRRGSS